MFGFSLFKEHKKKNFATYLVFLSVVGFFFTRGYLTTGLYMPKPKGYIRIDLPEHEYLELNKGYPFSFEYSKNAEIEKIDSNGHININYPEFSATIHITYIPLGHNQEILKKHWEQSHKLSAAHHIKATEIVEKTYTSANKIKFLVFEIFGERVASQFQFVTTDNKKHFIRGALYFNIPPDENLLLPIIKFIKDDMYHLFDTLKWKN